VALALQGGGSLGAYTWGVLDAFLVDGRLEIEGVTGASAGAINAAALGVGLSSGGRERARELLCAFWEALAGAAEHRRLSRAEPLWWLWRNLGSLTSARAFHELTAQLVTDFAVDPATMEPVRSTLDATLDYSALARPEAVHVFVNATNIRTAQPHVFSGVEVTTDALCASAAVPLLCEPVVIGGEQYWDGALLGNPLIYPVIYGCEATDVILVQTLPAQYAAVPRSAAEVISRTIELASWSGLVRELRMIDFVNQLLREGPRTGHREIRLHLVSADPALATIQIARAFRADLDFYRQLRDVGQERGRHWLASEAPLDGMAE
jgi:NTE family protein